MDGILEAVTQWAPDIITLQEVRARHVSKITDHLAEMGLEFSYMSDHASDTENGIFIAARDPIEAGHFMEDQDGLCHILEAEVAGLTLLPAHFPQKAAQVPLFDALLTDTVSLLGLKSVLIGDLNCGVPFEDSMTKTFSNAKYFQALKEAGWVDAYRKIHGAKARDYSWVSPRTDRGFRYDHALVSPAVATQVSAVRYDHDMRTSGLSDHSALIVDIDD
jgi:exonuclease III